MSQVPAIRYVRTVECIEELPTDGHAPMKFKCDDGSLYYCKYRKKLRPVEELDCLWYELVGHILLRQLDLPTPDVALVEVAPDSFDRSQLVQNASHLKPGVVTFGSRHVPGSLVNELFGFPSQVLERLTNPEQLIGIALFDLWVENADRGRPVDGGHNYNLLWAPHEGGYRVVAFDHAFILGGLAGLRTFHPGHPRPTVENKLFRTKPFHEVMAHLGAARRTTAVNQFFGTSLPRTSADALFDALDQCRPPWPQPPNFRARLTDFLWNPERLALLESVARSYFHQL